MSREGAVTSSCALYPMARGQMRGGGGGRARAKGPGRPAKKDRSEWREPSDYGQFAPGESRK